VLRRLDLLPMVAGSSTRPAIRRAPIEHLQLCAQINPFRC
jgi:hypothetical protein